MKTNTKYKRNSVLALYIASITLVMITYTAMTLAQNL